MEFRQLYKQGKSTVLVIPSKYLLSLGWESKDQISISLMPDQTLKLARVSPNQQLPFDQRKELP